jgi:hypothetical protein
MVPWAFFLLFNRSAGVPREQVMYKPRRPPSYEHDEQAHGPVDMATQY